MQRVRRDLAGVELGGEVEREHDLRQLGPAVGGDAVVAALLHRVGEVDRRLAGGRHLHDPGGRGRAQQRQQPAGQRVAGEVVDREAQLEAVRALHPGAGARIGEADARVGDEHMQPLDTLLHRRGQRRHLGQRCEVGAERPHAVELPGQRGEPLLAAAVGEHGPALAVGAQRERAAEPIGGAGDQHGAGHARG
jgi:hypothetical protein